MKKSYIPNIRFTNFFNIWDIKKLKQIGLIKKGQQINKLKLKETGKYYVLNGGISPSGYFDMYNTPMNTISISEGGNSCGFVTLNKEHFWSGGHNYTLSNLSIDTNYLFQYLKKQEQFIMTLRTGSGLPNIQKSRLENIIIFFPQKEEQIKLSKFFLDLDVLIQQQKIKLEYLNQLKKAMLEKMFPKENSNIPELRFKGFTETWEQCKLKNFTERIIEKNKNLDTLLPLTISTQYGLISQTEFFNKQIASKNLSNYYLLKKGDFAYNKSYSGEAPWGSIKRLDKYEKGALSTLYIAFKIKNINQIDSEFLNTFYKTNKWYTDIQNIATEGARNHGLLNISSNDFFETFIKIPNLEEQKKIGDFFSKIDSLITLHQYMYNKLFQVKNDIFPLYSAYYNNILHNFLPIIFTYTQPQYKSHTKKIH